MDLIDGHVRELLDAAPDAMVIADAHGTIVFVNTQTEALFGYERSELVGKQVEILLPERSRAAHPDKRSSYAHAPRVRPMGENQDLYARHRNGSEFPVEIRLSPLKTEQGVLISSAIRDVTARKKLSLQNLLLIQNDPAEAAFIRNTLVHASNGAYNVEWVRCCSDGVERLKSVKIAGGTAITAIMVDLVLPDSYGIETFDRLYLAAPTTPITVLCDEHTEAVAKQVVQRGARDYLLKGHLNSHLLLNAVSGMIERPANADTLFENDALFEEKERAQVMLNSIGDAVISADTQGHVTYLNPVAETMTGWSRADAAGRQLNEVMHIIDVGNRESVRNPILLAMEHNKNVNIADNCALIRRDGTEFAIEDSAAPIHDHRGHVTGAVMVFRDVSAARAIALKMAYLAQHDVLTGLPNRVLLNDRMTQAMASARRHDQQLALLFVDIDRFKHVNDSFGHSIGDQLLKAVAQRLLTCVRSTDTVCRFGGDEFVVLLSEISYPADGIVCADKIANELNMPYDIGEHRLHLTASIGISIYPNDGIDAETLLKNADSAMFRAKSNGRNNYQLFKPLDTLPTIDWQPRESDWRCATEQAEHKS